MMTQVMMMGRESMKIQRIIVRKESKIQCLKREREVLVGL